MTNTSSTRTIEVDINQIITDLNNKMDKTQITNYIAESYQSGSSWYKIYSDGWCQQGFELASTSANSATVSLLKAFKDTNYIVLSSDGGGTDVSTDTSGVDYISLISNKTTTTFRVSKAPSRSLTFFACGYIR